MPVTTAKTSAHLSRRHGDLTSLSQGADAASAVLRVPIEIWLHIFENNIKLDDLMRLRSTSKTFWVLAERAMPKIAREMHPAHADDPRIQDSFFAEALIAAHRLNVQDPFHIMIARDGSIDPPSGESHVRGGAGAADFADQGPGQVGPTAGVSLPSRVNWIIGSRRLLHEIHVKGRAWMFALCSSCKVGTCTRCQEPSNALHPLRLWWYRVPKQVAKKAEPYSNAIYGSDAFACLPCSKDESESAPFPRFKDAMREAHHLTEIQGIMNAASGSFEQVCQKLCSEGQRAGP